MAIIDMKIMEPDEFTAKRYLIVYTRGCNLTCSYCFNAHINNGLAFSFNQRMVEDLIVSNKDRINHITFTGGEPCLEPRLEHYISIAHKAGYTVEVCTNGTQPEVIQNILPYVDTFRIDYKAGGFYRHMFYTSKDWANLQYTIELLRNHIEVEYRTVLHKDTTKDYLKHTVESAWMSSIENYAITHDIRHTVNFDYDKIVRQYFPDYKEYRKPISEVAV
jgi:pyruvate formate lyase activating enzyme